MKKINYIYILCVLVMLLSSCVMSKKINYLQEGDNIPVYNDSVSFDDYKLQRGDYIYIHVNAIDMEMADMFNGNVSISSMTYMTPDNSTARLYLYLVEEDNCIDYPYVGRVEVEGKSLREVKLLLEEKLDGMLQGYSVDVRLANRSFSIIGESGTGRYNIPREQLTIYEALAMSGDLSLYANRKEVHLIRQTPEGTKVMKFDLRSKSIIDSEYYYIQPNDVIYIPFDSAKHWGANHFTSVLSMTFATVSFGLFVYSIVDTIIKASKQ
ncbi:MAG: polysaccharide biosynthesis/export family protein [Paludibacteraceae bacterium]|nr:polysaccharide biosynthesis/export family protein [Paludibacteraceae bacterium]MBQ8722414.1 polysaccharide biosynthesis/export family protein [Paludibacteraceae bacterium]